MPKLYLYAGAIFAVGILIGMFLMWFVDWQFVIKEMQNRIYDRDKRIDILSTNLEMAVNELQHRMYTDVDILGFEEDGDD